MGKTSRMGAQLSSQTTFLALLFKRLNSSGGWIRGIGAGLAFLMLTACASSYDDWTQSAPQKSGANKNFAIDSALAGQISKADQTALDRAFIDAMAQSGTSIVPWQGERSSGGIKPGDFLLANVLPDPNELLPTRKDISTEFMLETEQGDHVLTKNSNIRLGPSTDYSIVETLSAGTGVEGLGLVQGETWMLIAYEDRVRGYVYQPLLEKAPGAALFELAGGPVRQPHICREFEQSIDVSGQKDRWQGMACDFGEGWELAGRGGPTVLGDSF